MDSIVSLITDISRYIIIAIVLYTLFLVVDNSLSEYGYRKEAIGSGPGAYFGYLTVMRAPYRDLMGLRYGLKWESSIGSSKRCDVTVDSDGISKRHVTVYLKRDFAVVKPTGSGKVYINQDLAETGDELYDGDILTVGDVSMRLRLEMGGDRR